MLPKAKGAYFWRAHYFRGGRFTSGFNRRVKKLLLSVFNGRVKKLRLLSGAPLPSEFYGIGRV